MRCDLGTSDRPILKRSLPSATIAAILAERMAQLTRTIMTRQDQPAAATPQGRRTICVEPRFDDIAVDFGHQFTEPCPLVSAHRLGEERWRECDVRRIEGSPTRQPGGAM